MSDPLELDQLGACHLRESGPAVRRNDRILVSLGDQQRAAEAAEEVVEIPGEVGRIDRQRERLGGCLEPPLDAVLDLTRRYEDRRGSRGLIRMQQGRFAQRFGSRGRVCRRCLTSRLR